MPMLAGLQRWIVNFFLKDLEFTHTVDAGPAKGVNFPIKLPDDKGIWTGTYEQKFTQKIASLINEGDVCCDVGGWHGFVGAVMAVQGASAVHIFAHLPFEFVFECFFITVPGGIFFEILGHCWVHFWGHFRDLFEKS